MLDTSKKVGKFLYLVDAYGIADYHIKYDQYDSFIACADSEEEVRKMHPCDGNGSRFHPCDGNSINPVNDNWESDHWVQYSHTDKLKVTLLGKSEGTMKGVILTSYNAG